MTEQASAKVAVVAVAQAHAAQKKHVQESLAESGFKGARCQGISAVYRLEGGCDAGEVQKVCRELLSDPVVENFSVDGKPKDAATVFADVWYKPGVTDAVGDSVLRAIQNLGADSIARAFSGTRYEFRLQNAKAGAEKKIKEFVNGQLLNPLIQECKILKR